MYCFVRSALNMKNVAEAARKQQISKPKNSNKVKRLKKNKKVIRNTLRQKNTFLNSNPSQPVLRFTPYAWAKLLWLRDAGPTEIGGFGIAPSENPLLIEDLRLVNQVTTAVTVQFEDVAVADLFDDLVDAGLRPDQFARVWIHTHPGDSALPSSVDHETFERCFGSTDWAVMAILARGGENFASLRFHVGPGSTVPVPIQIAWEHPFSGTLRFNQRVTVAVLPPVPAEEAIQRQPEIERRMKQHALASPTPPRHFDPDRDGHWNGYRYEIDPAFPHIAERVAQHRRNVVTTRA
jgi:proteasome lid subunit RPN8/RPN11